MSDKKEVLLERSCRNCVWVKKMESKENVKRTYKWLTEEKRLVKLKKPVEEIKTVIDYYCQKYREHISNVSRAERCKYYTKSTDIVTLDPYTKGSEDIQTLMGFSGKDVF